MKQWDRNARVWEREPEASFGFRGALLPLTQNHPLSFRDRIPAELAVKPDSFFTV